MLLPTLLVTTLLCCVHAQRNLTEDVRLFVAKYREMNETKDVLGRLDRIEEDSREVFRLGRPVGQFLAKFNATGKVTTEEIAALAELHKLFDHSYEYVYLSSHDDDDGVTYISNRMDSLNSRLETLTNITRHSEMSAIYTIGRLKGKRKQTMPWSNPMAILTDLDAIARLGCRMPTKQGVQTAIVLQEALLRFEARGRSSWTEENYTSFVWYRSKVFDTMFSQGTNVQAKKLITIINELNITLFENASNVLIDSLHEIRDKPEYGYTSCILEKSLHSSDFNQTSLLLRLQLLYKDLIRIQILEWAMSSIAEVNENYYKADAEIATLMIRRTGNFLAEWTRKYLSASWPEVGIEFARRAVGNASVPIASFNETAKNVQKVFELYNSPSFGYQVLVLPTSEMDVSWSVGSSRIEDYTNITDFNGLDIHVFRFNKTEEKGRSANARKWMEKSEKRIMKEIRTGALTKTSTVLKNLQSESSIGPIYSDNLYRSVILLKKKKMFSTEVEIPVGLALSENAFYKIETTRTSYSVLDNGKETIYKWKAFFFL